MSSYTILETSTDKIRYCGSHPGTFKMFIEMSQGIGINVEVFPDIVEISLERFTDIVFQNLLENLKRDIEEGDGIDCMQEDCGDEWWFSNTFYALGEERYFSRLRYLWCTPLHGFWKKYQICLQDFCGLPDCVDFPQSVIVEFENTPSVMELLYTKCQIGYGLHQEKGTDLSIIRFIESNVELFGFEDTLKVKNIY